MPKDNWPFGQGPLAPCGAGRGPAQPVGVWKSWSMPLSIPERGGGCSSLEQGNSNGAAVRRDTEKGGAVVEKS